WPRMADISDSDEDDDSFADAAAAAAAAATARAPPPSLYSLCFAELADQARDHRGAASAPGLHNEDWRLAGQLLAHLSAAQPRAVRGRHLRDLAAGPGLTELDLTACCLLAPADLRAALPACPGLRRLRLAQCSQLVLDKRLLTDLPRLAPRLRCLELDQCDSLTGAALRCVLLSGRRRLRRLSAAACPLVCDSAFASLPAGGGRLRRVNLSGTRVTAAGLRDLCRFAGRHLRSLTATHLAELRPLFDCLAEISEATSVGEDERATEPIAMDRQADSAQPKPQSGGSSYHSCASESASSLADSDVADDSEADNFEDAKDDEDQLIDCADEAEDEYSDEEDSGSDDEEPDAEQGLAELDLAFCTAWSSARESLLQLCALRGRCLRSLSLASSDGLTEADLAAVCSLCPGLVWLDLRCCRLQLAGIAEPLCRLVELRGLDLSELLLTEPVNLVFLGQLNQLHSLHLDGWEELADEQAGQLFASLMRLTRLRCLSLNWCPRLTPQACRAIGSELLELRHFACRCNLADGTDLEAVISGCRKLESVDLSFIKGSRLVTDRLMFSVAANLQQLVKLDVSFNPFVTDRGVSSVLAACPSLQEADFSGLKQITSRPFLPIIHDLPSWRRTLALLRLRLAERAARWRRRASVAAAACGGAGGERSPDGNSSYVGNDNDDSDDDGESSGGDEDFEELELPRRSRVFAPALRILRLLVSDLINEDCMREIVAVCRGSLVVYGYSADPLEPRWVTIHPGRQRVLESALLSADV
ncbi:hypothetical protein BOX15_Mlig018667g2, partial [Macrostomum lignano]